MDTLSKWLGDVETQAEIKRIQSRLDCTKLEAATFIVLADIAIALGEAEDESTKEWE